MREVTSIMIMGELRGPGEGVVAALALCFIHLNIIFVVSDITTSPHPSNIIFTRCLFGVQDWLHPLIIQTAGLEEIHDSESVLFSCPCIPYSEVVPLCMLGND